MSNEIQQTSFDYSALNPVVAVEARSAAERIKIRMKRTAEDIVEIGRDLSLIKEKLGHGRFGEWISAEFDMSQSSATKIMQVAHSFNGKFVNFTNLNPSVLYQLAAPSTPSEVINQATQKAESGEKVTNKDIAEWKQKAKEAEERSEEWRKQALETKRKFETVEIESLRLKKEIIDLQNRKPETITVDREVIKEIIPEGYSTLEQAIAAKRRELAENEKKARELAGELLEKEQRRNAQTELQRKRGMLMTFRAKLTKLLSETEENQLVLASPSMSPEIDAELREIEKRLLTLAEIIREVRSTRGEYQDNRLLIGEVV